MTDARAPYVPPEPLPDDPAEGYRRLTKEFLDLHAQVHKLKQAVTVEHEDWLHTHEERLDEHDAKLEKLMDLVKDGQTATYTLLGATARQVAALSEKLQVPVVKGLVE